MEKRDDELPEKPAKSGCCGGCGEVASKPKAGNEAGTEKHQAAPVEPPEESCCGG